MITLSPGVDKPASMGKTEVIFNTHFLLDSTNQEKDGLKAALRVSAVIDFFIECGNRCLWFEFVSQQVEVLLLY